MIESLEIPLPPLDEQKRIAVILDKADQLRQKRRQAIALLDGLTESIFLEMFGDPMSNPHGFEAVELDNLVERKRGISYGIVQRGQEFSGGVPVLRIGDILDGEVTTDELVRTDPQIASKFQRTRLLGGELVISIRGTVGRCAVVPETLTGANVSREIAVIPSLERERNEFHLALIRTEPAQRRLRDDIKGVAQSGINLEDLRKLPIIRPPLHMVEKFLRMCSKLSAQRRRAKLFDELGEKTFSSLQHRAFSGQL
jgi:type I restriction enzyme S subunit